MNSPRRFFESRYFIQFMLALAAGVVMFVLLALGGQSLMLTSVTEAAVIGGLLCFLAALPLIFEDGLDWISVIVGAACAAALIYVRMCMFYYKSGDYGSFLYGWVGQMREMSLTEAMRADIGDYNMPYLYILYIISHSGMYDLYAIKAVSCIFDLVGAYFVMKIAAHFCDTAPAKVTAYLLTLALPTVWLNGAYWGQCDMMFTSLCLGMFYYILNKKDWAACIMWALALSFKLQAIFALPVLVLGVMSRRVRLRCTAAIIPTFFATLVPALLCGRSFMGCVSIYFEQASQYPKMYLNLPSIWSMLGDVEFEPWGSAATFIAGAAITLVLFLCWNLRDGLTDKNMLTAFFFTALLLPFLLPRMHDRYFFLADLASLAVFLVDRRKWYVPLVTVLASYSSYRYFVMGGSTLFDHKYFAAAILVLLTVTAVGLYKSLQKESSVTVSVPVEAEKSE